MKLDTTFNGFFSNDNKTFINLNVPKSSPHRKAKVLMVIPANNAAYPTLKKVLIKYPTNEIVTIPAYDLDEVNENIHCYYSPVK